MFENTSNLYNILFEKILPFFNSISFLKNISSTCIALWILYNMRT